jgi:hypothetical protein
MEPLRSGLGEGVVATASSDTDAGFATIRTEEELVGLGLTGGSRGTISTVGGEDETGIGGSRGGVVVLPRTVVVLWSILAVAASGFAFLAGWLLGRMG